MGTSSRRLARVFRNPSIATSVAFESLNLNGFQLRHVVHLLSRDTLILPHLLRVAPIGLGCWLGTDV
jgi:hypothetical protein